VIATGVRAPGVVASRGASADEIPAVHIGTSEKHRPSWMDHLPGEAHG
jgi:hypothetical protein